MLDEPAYTYGTAGNMASLTDWLGRQAAFAYDANNNLTAGNGGGLNEAWTYDTADNLTSVGAGCFSGASATSATDATTPTKCPR